MKTKYLILEYPSCSTSKKAFKWLEEHDIIVERRNIKEDNPTKEELSEWIKMSGKPIKAFFNTSGQVYRKNNLKEVVARGNVDEMLNWLSSDGMVVKRPLLISSKFVLVGFKEKEWEEKLL